ncbi:Glycoside hydrolase family 55 protein [Mycena venus]|uniref:Glycoside hydrolase family 55 protein n=1 Tax=Mycena venus TaxID=2733690 RepID=A0A8H7CJN4_9AGAR|nr:Glycoside hydrolase family 55 protein [Mycena venus]
MRLVGFLLHVLTIVSSGMSSQQIELSTSGLDSGLAASNDIFWLEAIKHQGKAAYNPDSSYRVKDFGAKGDGLTDDTEAIK